MRLALGLEFNGARFGGWQNQSHDPNTVQGTLERALARVANHPVTLIAAGRTDAGVHASGMVAHFDVQHERPERAWMLGVNTYLPRDISVRWAVRVDDDFHARFRAKSRRYRYVIYNHPYRSALWDDQVTWHYHPLDIAPMQEAAAHLVGEHDFTSFRAVQCQARHPVRNIHFAKLAQYGRLIVLDIQADGFLHHMVRNIAGVLMAIGQGKERPAWLREVLEARDRTAGGVTAPPNGLYFVDVAYPEKYVLPKEPPGPHFLAAFAPGI